jgi:positive regulator of sigma E activity
MYMLPLVFLLCGAVAGAHCAEDGVGSEAYSAAGGFAGLALGFAMAKVMALRRSLSSVATPVIMSSEI